MADITRRLTDATERMMRGESMAKLPFDPFAIAKATGDVAMSLAMRPQDLMTVQMEAAKQWGDFWIGALTGNAGEAPRDRRFMASAWQDDAYYRSVRDAYLLASKQLRDMVSLGSGNDQAQANRQQTMNTYYRAYAACMEGRGYTIR